MWEIISGPLAVIAIVLLIAGAIIVIPLLTIWSLNTLFGLSISYTIKTWFAALALSSLVGSRVKCGK